MDAKIKDNYCHDFGYYSIASLIIKYSEFISSVTQKYNDGLNPSIAYETMSYFSVLKDHYDSTRYVENGVNHIPYITSTIGENGIVYHYDESTFYRTYADITNNDTHSILLSEDVIFSLKGGAFYIYIITEDKKIIISDLPVSIQETLVSALRSNITHAHLAQPYNLSCCMAGEIIFIKTKENKVKGIYANNKSGHFRPGKENIEIAKNILIEALALTNEDLFFLTVQR